MTETVQVRTERGDRYIPRLVRGLEALVPRDGPAGERGGDRAALAALRRGLGKAPGEAPEMFPVLLPLLPEEQLPPWEEPVVYLVASLFALYQPQPPHGQWRGNLGVSMRQLAEQTDSNGPDRRFVVLLNSDGDDRSHHLRGIVGLLKSADPPIPVDWVQLTWDLMRWDNQDRGVQRRWATAFWGGRQAREAPDEPDQTAAE